MEFFRKKLGILTALLCLAALAGIVWFCLFGADRSESPDGTLVYYQQEEMNQQGGMYGSVFPDACKVGAAMGAGRPAAAGWQLTGKREMAVERL